MYDSVDKHLLHTLTAEVLETITSVTEIIKCIIYLVEIQIYKTITFPFVLYVCVLVTLGTQHTMHMCHIVG